MTGDAKVTCRGLWKVFGPHADRLFAGGRVPDEAALADGGHIAAVRDVSFDVATGEILMVMGLSGSGKSTLVRCLTRLIEPTAGAVLFDGVDLLSMGERALIDLRRHKMGMVFQHFGLLPHRTVLENVAFPLEIQGVPAHQRLDRAREMVALVGLGGREDYYPRELSGGQQQRVGIARSLAVEPEIWFLDEPFSALDPLIRREMQDEFLRLQQMLHKTIVFITHDFDEAVRLGDRIAIMRDGRVVQLGRPSALVLNPADDYVAQFTRAAPLEKLLTAGDVMDATAVPAHGMAAVAFDAKVETFARQALSDDADLTVLDAAGVPVGTITRGRLAETLFGAHQPVR
ncbi:MAG: glycine betaine/L-proline ABC transporter ATP-binding protein [Alphaproteobacteria bacterium]